jgi:5-methylcytosine-specific restriction protein A
MPRKPARPCRWPGCPALTDDRSGYCEQHLKQTRKQTDSERGNSNERGYTYRWHKYTKAYLAEHPLCAICAKKNPPVVRAASLVDHVKPHKGDYDLFWDPNNHQPLCEECHNIKTAREDGAFGKIRT